MALCASQLRDPFETGVPTESQIAERLAASGWDPGCDRKSVMKRLERARALVGAASNRELRDRMVDSGALTAEHSATLDRRS